MVDLDSNPTKLIEVVHIGKQMLMTRGSLTTFSIANDVAKYFAHYSGGVRGNVSAVKCAEHHAPSFARLRHSQCGHFQRLDYRLFDSSGVKRREL